jgi:ribosomal protein S18 acetylase RimI-like enzyme
VTAIRAAAPDDARPIAEVQVRTWQGAYAHVFPAEVLAALDVEQRERMWTDLLTDDSLGTFVAEEGGRIVGFVGVGPSRDADGEGELYAIYVDPSAWGSVAGQALIDAARDWLSDRYAEATLWVLEDNPRARRFYERNGWSVDSRRTEVLRGIEVAEVRYRVSFLGRR